MEFVRAGSGGQPRGDQRAGVGDGALQRRGRVGHAGPRPRPAASEIFQPRGMGRDPRRANRRRRALEAMRQVGGGLGTVAHGAQRRAKDLGLGREQAEQLALQCLVPLALPRQIEAIEHGCPGGQRIGRPGLGQFLGPPIGLIRHRASPPHLTRRPVKARQR